MSIAGSNGGFACASAAAGSAAATTNTTPSALRPWKLAISISLCAPTSRYAVSDGVRPGYRCGSLRWRHVERPLHDRGDRAIVGVFRRLELEPGGILERELVEPVAEPVEQAACLDLAVVVDRQHDDDLAADAEVARLGGI